ncbi:hypothetical protein DNTS_025362 [Danionella cerebrum]|uniref:Uncharacterized protein n=1 Tax=Danionella cerebrum TaxID=2873325 RepID=A0A553Q915_9TELE|nr:hypothetical protein DNTS_025362 [Danionella translucida]TRY86407.1 hypothetical protein DNTS_025362 [Danionella translucida]
MSRFRRYKYATSLPTWSPFMPRPPPPRSPSSKVSVSMGSVVLYIMTAMSPAGVTPLKRQSLVTSQQDFENQQQLSSRPRLPPLLKPLAAKEGHVWPIAAKIPAI